MEFEWLEQAAQLCLVLGFCGGVFNYIVIRPLNVSIQKLGDVIADLCDDLKNNNERLNQLEGELREVKYALQKAHDRIDEFLSKEAAAHERLGH